MTNSQRVRLALVVILGIAVWTIVVNAIPKISIPLIEFPSMSFIWTAIKYIWAPIEYIFDEIKLSRTQLIIIIGFIIVVGTIVQSTAVRRFSSKPSGANCRICSG